MAFELVYLVPVVIIIIVFILNYIITRQANGVNYLQDIPFKLPPWLFGVVWSILYILITIAWIVALVQIKDQQQRMMISFWFIFNLALNVLWSQVVFVERNPTLGVAIVLGLILSVVILIYYTPVVSRWLLVPYLLWLLFALSLNLFLVQSPRNRIYS